MIPLPAPSWQPACARAAVRRQQRLFAATEDLSLSLSGCSLLDAFQATGLDDINPAGFTARAHVGKGLGGCPTIVPLLNGATTAGGGPGFHRDHRASRGGGTQGGEHVARAKLAWPPALRATWNKLGKTAPPTPACRRSGRHVAQLSAVPGLAQQPYTVTLTVLPFSQVLVLSSVQPRPPGTRMLMAGEGQWCKLEGLEPAPGLGDAL